MEIRKNPLNLNKRNTEEVIDNESTRLIDSMLHRRVFIKKKEDNKIKH